MLLPSASLLQSQEEWRARMQRFTGGSGVPGIQSNTKTATPPAGGGRP
jgi:hypothetical protein